MNALSNRFEDAENGFFIKFYIDLVISKISQLFFRRIFFVEKMTKYFLELISPLFFKGV